MPQASGDAPTRLGLILLGASEFPAYREEGRDLDFESFKRSAEAFRRAVETPGHSIFGAVEVLDLFDSPAKPDGIVEAIQTFLHARPDLQDLIIYYCGHGGFLTNKTYTLLIRASHPWREASTTLPFELTRESLDRFIVNRRLVLVLDCCFAGEAVKFLQSETMGDVIEQQVFHTFPPSGTTLLLASSKDRPGLAPGGEDYTMFTGALVQVLEKGIKGGGPQLTLEDLLSEATQQIRVRWRSDAVIPDIQSPRRAHGDLARRPYFVNAAYAAPRQPSASRLERTLVGEAFESLRADSPRARRLAVEQIVEIVRDTSAPALRRRMLNVLRGVARDDDSQQVREFAGAALLSLGAAQTDPVPARPKPQAPPPETAPPKAEQPSPPKAESKPAPASSTKPAPTTKPEEPAPPTEPRASMLQHMIKLFGKRVAVLLITVAVLVVAASALVAFQNSAGGKRAVLTVGSQTLQFDHVSWLRGATGDISVLGYRTGGGTAATALFFSASMIYLHYDDSLPGGGKGDTAVITGIVVDYDPTSNRGTPLSGTSSSFVGGSGQSVPAFALGMERRVLAKWLVASNWILIGFIAPGNGQPSTLVLPVDNNAKALWQAVADKG